ncbi:Omega-6 fatty acid desaturase, endoplasmic reticulum isozyme 1 [Aphelenchoides fujianensis]|nr:Omega-6 fatty acid desaturase, endoplasmic reticulum isozyme 1 [Aphelenchoides fujianensis]
MQNEIAKQPLAYPTYEEIRRAIPPQCFEKSLPKSLFYLVFDYAIIAGFYFAVPYVEEHTTFSNYPIINDLCGHLAHAPLLALGAVASRAPQVDRPFDQGQGPRAYGRGALSTSWTGFAATSASSRSPAFFLWQTYTILGLPDGSHFWPFSSMFTTWKQRVQCVISGLCCCLAAGVALVLCDYNWTNFFKYYYMPLCFYGLWLVMITYLQHTDEEAVVYEEGHWNFVKGTERDDRPPLRLRHRLPDPPHHLRPRRSPITSSSQRSPTTTCPEATKAIKKVFEKYPGVYRSVSTYDHLLEFLRLNVKLDYLVGKGTGMLKYRTSQSAVKKAE